VCRLHTLIYTSSLETKLQYLGLNLENAESLAPLSFSQYLVPEQIPEECELRDVMGTSLVIEVGRLFSQGYVSDLAPIRRP